MCLNVHRGKHSLTSAVEAELWNMHRGKQQCMNCGLRCELWSAHASDCAILRVCSGWGGIPPARDTWLRETPLIDGMSAPDLAIQRG
ncbi:Protein of unknown function [Gryllus bimaculatus]|nr:Protein of unknown function [Gryllus bimaculatus]